MQMFQQTYPTPQIATGATGFSAFAWSTLATLISWQDRKRQRQALAKLDAHLLDDIGVTTGFVAEEVAKPVWVK